MSRSRGATAAGATRGGRDTLVEARAVSRTVSGLRILDPVSLRVHAGECVAVQGENGSGKTTLLRLLVGLDRPTSGSVRLSGAGMTPRDVAAVLGIPPFFENLTILEHLVFVRASWGLPPGTEGPMELLDAFDAGRLARHFPDELSSGERQVVALCLGLARPARLLVLDEPEQRLDTGRRAALAQLVRDRVHAGTGVVMATHAPDLADAAADRSLHLTAAE